jgi:ornithine cyclodeaminase
VSVSIVSADALRAAVGFEDLVEPVGRAFQEFSGGLAEAGLLTMYPAERPDLGDVYVKTGRIRGRSIYVVKISPWFAVNVGAGRPQGGFIAVFDARTGYTRAILAEEHYLSDIRTAAAGALAARVLAPQAVRTATVLGTGTQAFWQPRALFAERPFERLIIWGRDRVRGQRLAGRLQPHLPGVRITLEENLEIAVRAADVLLTTTASREPLVLGEWLHPGQHITAVGADDQTKCELDAECLRRADRLIVDSLESARSHGEVARHLAEGTIRLDQVHGEIGSVLSGDLAGRRDDNEITIAKFIGLGVQDLAAAEVSLQRLAS